MGSMYVPIAEELDALVVGAGFGGVYQLKKLCDEGYKARLVDTASSYGGVWYWNRYPGARVDSDVPHYQFCDPELWENWHWTQRFPDHNEIRAYFEFVADKWNLRKNTYFNTHITSAIWDESQSKWIIASGDGRIFKARFFLPNTGIAAKRYFPDWKGIGTFKGTMLHSSWWPQHAPDLAGKRVALVGTGATGVQLSQSLAKVASELVVFQRTPALAIPMGQVDYGDDEDTMPKSEMAGFFKSLPSRFFGLDFQFIPHGTFDDDEDRRRARYEELWKQGNFAFWLGCYSDMIFTEQANNEAYKFWREKTVARIRDPRVQELLAPEVQPYAFGLKRVPLENGYFEVFNKPNVHLVDINKTPVTEVTENGLQTSEKAWDFDIVILATGFDAVDGSLSSIDIRGIGGQKLGDKWQQAGHPTTYLGMSVAGFPNMFFASGPHGPDTFCNGPTCAELQGDWIVGAMKHMRKNGLASLVADEEYEKAWFDEVQRVAHESLLAKTKSWYMGDNIPGKPRSSLMYLGGVPTYYGKIDDCAMKGYMGFHAERARVESPIMPLGLWKDLLISSGHLLEA